MCWGWNADGRAGNATATQITRPQIAHKSAMRNYIGADAGAHHSLLVSEEGEFQLQEMCYISILLLSCVTWSGAFDSSDVHLSYPVV